MRIFTPTIYRLNEKQFITHQFGHKLRTPDNWRFFALKEFRRPKGKSIAAFEKELRESANQRMIAFAHRWNPYWHFSKEHENSKIIPDCAAYSLNPYIGGGAHDFIRDIVEFPIFLTPSNTRLPNQNLLMAITDFSEFILWIGRRTNRNKFALDACAKLGIVRDLLLLTNQANIEFMDILYDDINELEKSLNAFSLEISSLSEQDVQPRIGKTRTAGSHCWSTRVLLGVTSIWYEYRNSCQRKPRNEREKCTYAACYDKCCNQTLYKKSDGTIITLVDEIPTVNLFKQAIDAARKLNPKQP